jgi:hypothetical protein
MGKVAPCSPNCGQVVINNGGGSCVININCCQGNVWTPCSESDTVSEEETPAGAGSDEKETPKKWPLWAKEEL